MLWREVAAISGAEVAEPEQEQEQEQQQQQQLASKQFRMSKMFAGEEDNDEEEDGDEQQGEQKVAAEGRPEMDIGKWCEEAGAGAAVEDAFFDREIDTLGELAEAVASRAELGQWLAMAKTANATVVAALWCEIAAIKVLLLDPEAEGREAAVVMEVVEEEVMPAFRSGRGFQPEQEEEEDDDEQDELEVSLTLVDGASAAVVEGAGLAERAMEVSVPGPRASPQARQHQEA